MEIVNALENIATAILFAGLQVFIGLIGVAAMVLLVGVRALKKKDE